MPTRKSTIQLRHSLALVTAAGCLAVVFETALSSPATTEFFRALGTTNFQFGLLSGIPMIMLFMQFVGALAANRLESRKPSFMVLTIVSRLLFLVVACLPLVWPPLRNEPLVMVLIFLMAARSALANLVGPLWVSWMGDLIPRRFLSSYWGIRQGWMQAAWMLAYAVVSLVVLFLKVPISLLLPILAVIGCTAGVVDILLFAWVSEPKHQVPADRSVLRNLMDPLRHPEYRIFVFFSCAWTFAVMSGGAFMQIYLLEVLKVSVGWTTVIWAVLGVGSVLTARGWGRIIDEHGSRPVLVFCTSLKWAIVAVFVFLTPENVVIVLPVAFFFDSILNAGMVLAVNGYMLRIAPRENRAMFVAAISGLSGIFGGLGAMAGGAFLSALSFFDSRPGTVLNKYQLLFAAGVVLRMSCIFLARRIREPESTGSLRMLDSLKDKLPFRILLFPLGLYRRMTHPPEGV